MMKKRPHIIIFNPDEMRWDTMAHMGNPAAVTPYLDNFAQNEAVSFSNAFCQNPVCVPSRCSFFTGLYPHVHGHRTVAHLLRPGETTLLKEMRESGYHVWMNSRNDLTAAQVEGWTESHADTIFYGGDTPKAPGPINPNPKGSVEDKQFYSHYHGQLALDENGRNYTGDDEVVDAAINQINNRPLDKPLCMFLGLMYPHTPYQVEEPYYSAIDRSKLMPRVRADQCQGKPRMQQLLREYQHMDEYTDQDWDELRATYLGMCMKVDQQFGKLCDALKAAGIYEDSAIFFFSDHGDFAGDYDLPEKAQNCFEDCLTKVPLLIKPPSGYAADPGISDSLVELVDFYATAMDYAGVAPSHTHFGKSLHPVLEKRDTPHREVVFCEGGRMPGETHCDEYHAAGQQGRSREFVYWPRKTAQRDDFAHAKGTMIRDQNYKYIMRAAGQDEFYDLRKDPSEMINRIEDHAYAPVVAAMQIKMLRWYQETCDVVPFDFDKRFTPEMLWARIKSAVPQEKAEEVKQRLKEGLDFTELAKLV